MSSWSCGVLNCGGGTCVHKVLEARCPCCGNAMVENNTNGARFCSSPQPRCDYEDDTHLRQKSPPASPTLPPLTLRRKAGRKW